mgnify:FL=1
MRTLKINKNRKKKREHRAKWRTSNLRIMKRKIISFIGLALFVGAVAFNVQMTNSNSQTNTVKVKKIEALASTSTVCKCRYWYMWDNQCTVNGDNEICSDGDDCDAHDSSCDWFD